MKDQAQGLRDEMTLIMRLERLSSDAVKWHIAAMKTNDWNIKIKSDRIGKLADKAFDNLLRWRDKN